MYFWLFPAYIAMYTILPKMAGGRLFSDEMGRVAFIMLLVIERADRFPPSVHGPQQSPASSSCICWARSASPSPPC